MIQFMVLEDDKNQLMHLRKMLAEKFQKIKIHAVQTYEEAWECLTTTHIHLFLLDIDLQQGEEHNGAVLAERLRQLDKYQYTPILFLTSVPGPEKQLLNATHCYSYLMKPYEDDMLIENIQSLLRSPLLPESQIDIQNGKGVFSRVPVKSIIYAETYRHELVLHCENGDYTTRQGSLNELCVMSCGRLIQCHKSYAINLNKIARFHRQEQYLQMLGDEKRIPIGRKYMMMIKELFEQHD